MQFYKRTHFSSIFPSTAVNEKNEVVSYRSSLRHITKRTQLVARMAFWQQLILRPSTGNSRERSSGPTTLWFTVGGSSLVVLCIAWYRRRERQRRSHWLPAANVGFFTVAREMAGPQEPLFLWNLAKTMPSQCFRLPIPWGVGGVHVIGDPVLSRKILLDATTSKPRSIYRVLDPAPNLPTMFTSGTDRYVKAVRKSMAAAFAKHEIARMNAVALEEVDAWIQRRLAPWARDEATFDPVQEMARLTFKVINVAAFEYTPTDEEFESFMYHNELFLREIAGKQPPQPWRKVRRKGVQCYVFVSNYVSLEGR